NDANLTWSLAGPAGNAVSGRAFTSSDAGGISSNPVLNLFAAGDYTLTVERTGDGTGAYQFALRDLRAAAPLTPGAPVNGSLSPANETDLYRFPAAAGDRFFFDAQTLAGAPGATWRFIDPYGNVLFNTPFADVAALTVSQPGTYTLLVEGGIADTGTGTYAFTVQPQGNVPPPSPPASTPAAPGSVLSAPIAAPGEQARSRFPLPARSLLYFDALPVSPGLTWTLTGPAGTAVGNRNFANSDAGGIPGSPVLNLVAGDYLLTVAGAGGATGAYSFRLSDLAQAAALIPGTPVRG